MPIHSSWSSFLKSLKEQKDYQEGEEECRDLTDLRTIIIWLAGLISTDGSVVKIQNSLSFVICSIEKEWLELIQKRLLEVGIKSTFQYSKHYGDREKQLHTLYIKEPFKIAFLIKRFAKDYMNPRKLKILESGYHGAPERKWNEDENRILSDLFSKNISRKELIKEARKYLNRTTWGINHQLTKLGLRKYAN